MEGVRTRAEQSMGPSAAVPPYRALLDREGVGHPTGLLTIGDEQLLADQVAAYAAAGATDLVYTQTATGSVADERRTWTLLGEPTAQHGDD